jgi:zinc protease
VEVQLIFKKYLLFFVSLMATLCMSAGSFTSAYTSLKGQASGITYPIVKRDSLLNGLQFITLEKPGSGNVSLRVRIGSGAMFDLAGKGGLADITAAMLLKGGGGFTAKTVEDTVEQLGMAVKVKVNWDATEIEVNGPVDSLEAMFDLLGRLVITPTFDQKEFESLIAQRSAALKAESGTETEVMGRKAAELVFGSHPFGKPVRGTPESLKQISRHDLLYYHKKFYLANNALLIASGDVTAETVTKISRAKLGSWKKGEKVEAMFRPPELQSARRIVVLDRPDTQSPQAILEQVGISRRSPDYFAALVMSEVLRANLTKQAAEKFSLEFEPRMIEGVLAVRVKSSNDNLIPSIDQALGLMSALQSAPPSAEQVEAAKALLITKYAESLKSDPTDVLFDVELYGLGRDYLITYVDRVRGITAAEIQQAAQKYLKPQAVAIVIAGQAKVLENELKKLGNVTITL